jgi:hypothetical protein
MLGTRYGRRLRGMIMAVMLAAAVAAQALPGEEPSVDALKARLSETGIGGRPHVCIQIAELQLNESDKLYTAGDLEQAQARLMDVVAYSELARDYAIQSHKYQKQTEIAVRAMTRKLNEILHVVAHDDQAPVRDAVNRLQRVRDDLLAAMFPRGAK